MDGRCKNCTLEEKLKKLQVLRFITCAYDDEFYQLGFTSNANGAQIKKKIIRSTEAAEKR